MIGQVDAVLQGRPMPADPSVVEQREIVLAHYDDMLRHYGKHQGSRIARKHICWYSKGLSGSAEFRASVNRIDDPAGVQASIGAFYGAAADRMAA